MTKSKKLTLEQYKIVFEKAFEASRRATDTYLMEHPGEWFPCGFAWVHFEGRDPAVTFLKHHYGERGGHKAYPKGWDVWNPSGHGTQCLDAKMAGAQEFARICSEAGISCYADSRWD